MNLITKSHIEKWYSKHKEEIVEAILRFVSIPSIAQYSQDGFLYGKTCREAMDLYQHSAEGMGMVAKRFDDHVIAVSYDCDNECKTLGLWTHLDVVPPGAGWKYSPFEPVCEQGYIIGRGADDNKSAVVGVLYLLRCIKELGIQLRNNLIAFCGCDEEYESRGVRKYLENHSSPEFSIVPDCDFPVCYGEKGIITATLRSKRTLSNAFLSLQGGVAPNIIPDSAFVVLKKTPLIEKNLPLLSPDLDVEIGEQNVTITAHGISSHAGFPIGCNNAIQNLVSALLDAEFVDNDDYKILSFIRAVTQDYYGEALTIEMSDEESGRLTAAGTMLTLDRGCPGLVINIRYCITANGNDIKTQLLKTCAAHNFELYAFCDSPPNHFPRDHPMVEALTNVYQSVTGSKKEPYVMSGGTYARHVQNAIGFGIGGLSENSCPFLPEGHGGAHMPDEALNINNYFRALVVLTLAVLEADKCLSTIEE